MSGPRDDRTADGRGSDDARDAVDRSRDPPPSDSETAGRDRDSGDGWAIILHDIVTSVIAVVLVGAFLFAVSGIWPPLVAVESGSMDPNMQKNDLVFVMEEHRFPGEGAVGDTGIVTFRSGSDTGSLNFDKPGDVIVYQPNGRNDTTPIIHRAMFWVDDGERWYDRANESYVGNADSCADLHYCPAPHAGFVTKGDHNSNYDQIRNNGARTGPVSPEWIIGTAEYRIPGLGWVRLRSS